MHTVHSFHASAGTPLCLQFDIDIEHRLGQLPATEAAGGQRWEAHRAVYSAEAVPLVQALLQHLPGGLVDALFAELCAYKASVFKVTHEQAGQ